MRTTIDISEEKLNKALSLSGSRKKKDVVNAALDEFIRKNRIQMLLDLKGKKLIDENYDILKIRGMENEE